jgi:hypothetical protein
MISQGMPWIFNRGQASDCDEINDDCLVDTRMRQRRWLVEAVRRSGSAISK